MTWYTALGWLGALLFIIAYLLLTLKKNFLVSYAYHGLNILGSILLIINALLINDLPNVFVNSVWGIIGLYATLNKIKK